MHSFLHQPSTFASPLEHHETIMQVLYLDPIQETIYLGLNHLDEDAIFGETFFYQVHKGKLTFNLHGDTATIHALDDQQIQLTFEEHTEIYQLEPSS
jgi:hypothetical protein